MCRICPEKPIQSASNQDRTVCDCTVGIGVPVPKRSYRELYYCAPCPPADTVSDGYKANCHPTGVWSANMSVKQGTWRAYSNSTRVQLSSNHMSDRISRHVSEQVSIHVSNHVSPHMSEHTGVYLFDG